MKLEYPQVAPSVLSLDFSRLDAELNRLVDAGVKMIHYDVMDGHFTPWISFGEHLFKFFTNRGLFTDVHLMVQNPLPHAEAFINLGADQVTVHYETLNGAPEEFLQAIEPYRKGRIIGLALNPETPLSPEVLRCLAGFDRVMVMSVHPGRSGQTFIPGSETKIAELKKYIDANGLATDIEVDGGINAHTGPLCLANGASVLVSGAYICMSSEPAKALEEILGRK